MWITEVAARHEVYPSLLFNWRRDIRKGLPGPRCLQRFVSIHLKSSLSDSSAPPARQPTGQG